MILPLWLYECSWTFTETAPPPIIKIKISSRYSTGASDSINSQCTTDNNKRKYCTLHQHDTAHLHVASLTCAEVCASDGRLFHWFHFPLSRICYRWLGNIEHRDCYCGAILVNNIMWFWCPALFFFILCLTQPLRFIIYWSL